MFKYLAHLLQRVTPAMGQYLLLVFLGPIQLHLVGFQKHHSMPLKR